MLSLREKLSPQNEPLVLPCGESVFVRRLTARDRMNLAARVESLGASDSVASVELVRLAIRDPLGKPVFGDSDDPADIADADFVAMVKKAAEVNRLVSAGE